MVPLPPPLYPGVVGGEVSVQQVSKYRLGRPIAEEEYWELTAKPLVGVGSTDAYVGGGIELSNRGTADLVFPDISVGPFGVEIQPDQVMLSYQSGGEMGPSIGYGIQGHLPQSRVVLAEEQHVIDVGGPQLFGWRYVGQDYQFVRELDRSLVKGWLMAKCKQRGLWPMFEAGPGK
jgi:hypothetical protein